MGTYIYEMIIPERISKSEWKAVYNESLKLVDNFPFLDLVNKTTECGNEYMCAIRTRERNNIFAGYTGWQTYGDMYTGANTEDFGLYNDLDAYSVRVKGKDNGADVLTFEIDHGSYPELKKIDINAVNSIMGGKTQGEKSHVYLLAIACLIENRFPKAAFVYGDIYADQCKKAVEWANQFLDKPIRMPVESDAVYLLERLLHLEGAEHLIDDGRILELFNSLFVGDMNIETGNAIRKYVSEETVKAYFRKEFKNAGKYSMSGCLERYFSLGFGIELLADLFVIDPDGLQKSPAEFLDMMFETEYRMEDEGTCPSNLSEEAIINASRKVLRSIRNIEDDIQLAIQRNKYKRMMEKTKKKKIKKEKKKRKQNDESTAVYDINRMEDIVYYTLGCTVEPNLDEVLSDYVRQIHALTDGFSDFLKKSRSGREQKLIRKDRSIVIPDFTWNRILDNIMDDEYIERYYTFLSVNVEYQKIFDMISRFMMNPDLLDYYWERTSDKKQ